MAVFYFLVCLLCTTIGAISGVGGGVIIKPIFDAVSGLSVSTIGFLSGCTVLAMATVSLLAARNGAEKVDKRRGTLIAIGASLGGLGGKGIFDVIKKTTENDALIGVLQSGMMVLLTIGVLIYVLNKGKIKTHDIKKDWVCLMIGLLLGVISAFLCVGGGPINIAVLFFLFSMDTKTASLNSIYIIFFSQLTSFASTLLQQKVPPFEWKTLLVMMVGGVLGGLLGRKFSQKLSAATMDKMFNGLLVTLIFINLYNSYHYGIIL